MVAVLRPANTPIAVVTVTVSASSTMAAASVGHRQGGWMYAAEYQRIIALDVETTGLDADCAVVEIAWIELGPDLAERERVSSLIRPDRPIDPAAIAVHGITEAMVVDAPGLDQFIRVQRGDPFATGATLAIAHNASFDRVHLAPYCERLDTLCTRRLAQQLIPDLTNHRLETVAAALGWVGDQPHRALEDAAICGEVARRLAARVEDGLDGLLRVSADALAHMRMPFGKHRGLPIQDLPADYVAWMRRTLDRLDGDLAACLDLHHPR